MLFTGQLYILCNKTTTTAFSQVTYTIAKDLKAKKIAFCGHQIRFKLYVSFREILSTLNGNSWEYLNKMKVLFIHFLFTEITVKIANYHKFSINTNSVHIIFNTLVKVTLITLTVRLYPLLLGKTDFQKFVGTLK